MYIQYNVVWKLETLERWVAETQLKLRFSELTRLNAEFFANKTSNILLIILKPTPYGVLRT